MQKAVLFKIKAGKRDVWYKWCEDISTKLRSEAILSLQEERVLQELTLGFSIDNEEYIIGYMDGDYLPANMDREINKRHQEMKKECLEMIGEVNVLYDIKNNL